MINHQRIYGEKISDKRLHEFTVGSRATTNETIEISKELQNLRKAFEKWESTVGYSRRY